MIAAAPQLLCHVGCILQFAHMFNVLPYDWNHDLVFVCRWVPIKTVHVPSTAAFTDYSGMAFSGKRFGIVSQVEPYLGCQNSNWSVDMTCNTFYGTMQVDLQCRTFKIRLLANTDWLWQPNRCAICAHAIKMCLLCWGTWHNIAGEFCTLGWELRLWAYGVHQFGQSLSLSSRQQLRHDILYSWRVELDWSSQDRSHTGSGQGRPTVCVHTQRPVYRSVHVAAWLLMLKLVFCWHLWRVVLCTLLYIDLFSSLPIVGHAAESADLGHKAAQLDQGQQCSKACKHVSLTAIC